jgi:hypothetical protein
MIKDIVLHLSADTKHEPAANYAVSVANAFGAHLVAITFAHEPVLLATVMGRVPAVDFIDAQRALAEKAANAAMTKLSETARRLGVVAEARLEIADSADAADIFGHFAPRFDLSIVGQVHPDVVGPQI